jgi:signal-transduction protein with cAMP-binding, CBS, and nucleotidyltransferase domain
MICPNCAYDNLPGSEHCSHCQNDLTQLDRPVAQDRVERSLMEDPVSVLRPGPSVTLPPTAPLSHAIQTMIGEDVGAVLIAGEDGRLLGIFSERDVLTKVAGKVADWGGRPVAEFMTAGPATVRPDDVLAFVLHQMDAGGYRHLPVTEDGRPQGMISVRGMLRHVTRLCKAF